MDRLPIGLNEQKNSKTALFLVKLLTRHGPLGDVLDVGCGTGEILRAAHQLGAKELAGVDTAQGFIESARLNVPQAALALADVQSRLPFENGSFDSLFLCDVIEHLHDPVAALTEIRRVLRPAGRVFITTPNANSIVRVVSGERWFALADESHILFYTSFTLGHLLRKMHFEICEMAKKPMTGSPIKDTVLTLIRDGGTLVCVAQAFT